MKIQCDVCETTASLLCCADEAALCWGCDEKVHAANKLAGKHQRLPLLFPGPSSTTFKMPCCDICQEKTGFSFFCLEDRALLCRHCDLTIHSASPVVSNHQRFLITGVRVGLQHSVTDNNGSCRGRAATNELSSSSGSVSSSGNLPVSLATKSLGVEKTDDFKLCWPWNEIFEGVDFDHCYGLSEPGSSN
ncbi:B-box zinc finger protein 22-like [Phalaenopsis equestris]|uniref:B-box zinc finger protein 22-like n=1 Tax=Phalaenopsis equestris TaxID=78828 RepID=UPI0009E2BE5F|nr:B-box zinc finger protein 22-like [Phalaenopsis equestris]XP_020596970.1 B-box zinc finger protein 22-like [Phalaenopsis equestris]